MLIVFRDKDAIPPIPPSPDQVVEVGGMLQTLIQFFHDVGAVVSHHDAADVAK